MGAAPQGGAPERQGRAFRVTSACGTAGTQVSVQTSRREAAWGRDAATHGGVKDSAARTTRRDLCSEWQPPNSAGSGQAQARRGDACKELWDYSLRGTKPGTPERPRSRVCISVIKATLYSSLSKETRPGAPPTPLTRELGSLLAELTPPSLRTGSLHFSLAFLWPATPQHGRILTSFLFKRD